MQVYSHVKLLVSTLACTPIQQLDQHNPDATGNEALRQVALADVLMLNKIDLVSEEYLHDVSTRIRWALIKYTSNLPRDVSLLEVSTRWLG